MNVRLAAALGTFSGLACVVGVSVLVRFDNVWLKRSLGAVLVLLWLWQIALEKRVKRVLEENQDFDVCERKNFLLAAVTGTCSGLLSGLFSTPGPPNMIFVLVAQVSSQVFSLWIICY